MAKPSEALATGPQVVGRPERRLHDLDFLDARGRLHLACAPGFGGARRRRLLRRLVDLLGRLLHLLNRTVRVAPVRANPLANALSGFRHVGDDGHRLVAERIDCQPERPDQQGDRDRGPDRARHAQALQASDERREGVADQDADDDRNQDRLRVLQDQHDTEHRNHSERQVPDIDGWPRPRIAIRGYDGDALGRRG